LDYPSILDGLNRLRSQGTSRWGPQLGPAFALLDPDSMELEWTTIEAIAQWTGLTPRLTSRVRGDC